MRRASARGIDRVFAPRFVELVLTPEERERDRATGQWHLQVMGRLERPRVMGRLERPRGTRVVADALARARRWTPTLRATVARLVPRPVTVARATVAVLAAVVLAPWALVATAPRERRPAVPAPTAADVRARLWYARTADILASPGPEELKLALVETLRRDPADAATRALVRGIDDSSILVSMASLRALAGRPCDAVGDALARGLADDAWQRRAWAAKILGENGCRAASPRLAERLRVEQDARVERHLSLALYTLGARAGR